MVSQEKSGGLQPTGKRQGPDLFPFAACRKQHRPPAAAPLSGHAAQGRLFPHAARLVRTDEESQVKRQARCRHPTSGPGCLRPSRGFRPGKGLSVLGGAVSPPNPRPKAMSFPEPQM